LIQAAKARDVDAVRFEGGIVHVIDKNALVNIVEESESDSNNVALNIGQLGQLPGGPPAAWNPGGTSGVLEGGGAGNAGPVQLPFATQGV
jgi:hypothetical protein